MVFIFSISLIVLRIVNLEIPSNSLPALSTGNPETSTNAGGASEWSLRSFFGRINYNFNDKYLFVSEKLMCFVI